MCDLWDNIFMCIVAILILLALLFGCHLSNDAEWNDGKCSCGGSWQYEQAVGHQFYTAINAEERRNSTKRDERQEKTQADFLPA